MSGQVSFASLKPESLTWDTATRLFALRCKSQNLSEKTQALYARHIRTFRAWLTTNESPSPANVNQNHIRAYLEACKERGNRTTTVDCVFRILRTFWRVQLRDGLILLDPMARVERPRQERRFVKPVTEDQLRAILAGLDTRDVLGQRDYALILFLADSGLRISEATSVKVNEIDWATNSVTVIGKGRKERRVAFGQTARKALLAWVNRRGGLEGSEWLWVNRFGEKLTPDSFQQRMKKLTLGLGIAAERLSPHALRHFFALSFLKNGGDVMALQKLLGHASLDMVRNYVNMTDDDALAKHREASPLDKMGPLPNERKRVRLK